MLDRFKRLLPAAAFFGGFLFDALTIGRRVRTSDFWTLGGQLAVSALLILWLARRHYRATPPPCPAPTLSGRLRGLLWQAPYLTLQFVFGGMFSALFILYFKSAGYLGTWLSAAFLGALLVANEFLGRRYAHRFSLTWGLFGLNAILLMNFALPHLIGSLDPAWFYVSTLIGALLVWALWRLSPGRPGRVWAAWGVAILLVLAWRADLIAPVPLVKRDMAVGSGFSVQGGRYVLTAEQAPFWQPWRTAASRQHVAPNGRLYGVSAVFAPLGVTAPLEHRWEWRDAGGDWRVMARIRFEASGGREQGFRGHSWVNAPAAGEWRLIVATQDGRTVGILPFKVASGEPSADRLVQLTY